MKQFTNLSEFHSQLKVDGKIVIIEHQLIGDETNDNEYEGTITEVGEGYFNYKYKKPSAIIDAGQLYITEIPWTGSHALLRKNELFCAVYHCNSFSGESSTILFKNSNSCYTFALHPDEPSCCPTCKGSGMKHTTISELGKSEKQISISSCYDCEGKPVNAEEGEAIQIHIEELEEMWCSCGGGDAYHVPDRPGVKHHWNCKRCHKLKQVG